MRNLVKLAVPLGVVGIVLLLIMPIPAAMLDLLIVVNILLAMVILLTSMFVKKPLDFSVFPSLLLVATLLRLSLNVASTRLVLGDGYAGEVIQAMGHVVVGGSLVIGLVIFLILVVIQFVVITKGAERVAEVGARFTLDAMPGKQMAIDADLNAGIITDEQARARRAEVASEADFYGAMDGASKFVKGDAIAGIIITIVNLLGGIGVGLLQRGLDIGEAANTYSILTVGDGLVTQIPALLMAVATGMIVTRSNAEADMGSSASEQLTQSSQALMIAGAGAICMSLIPGMPKLPFVAVGATLIVIAQRVKTSQKHAQEQAEAAAEIEAAAAPETDTTEALIEEMRVAPLEILLAPDLISMVRDSQDDLLGRVKTLRHKIALELGVVLPPVRTRDAIELPPAHYSVRIAGIEAGRGQAPEGMVLALGDNLKEVHGQATAEPVFGLPGKWVPLEMRHSAEMTGATVVDRVSVLITHLSAIITDNAHRLLSREDVRVLTEGVKVHNPAAVEELTPNPLALAQVHQVLQGLLLEHVPINDLPRIYEALSLAAKTSTEAEPLIEAARTALGPALAAPHVAGDKLRVIMLAPPLEQALMEGLRPGQHGTQIVLDPERMAGLLTQIKESVTQHGGAGPLVLVCAPALRPALSRMVRVQVPDLPVLSYTEATSAGVTVETVKAVNDAAAISG